MHTSFSGRFSSDINFDDVLTLNKILTRYDFELYHVDNVRSAYKIVTDKGTFCLKKLNRGHKRALKSYFIINHLNSKGFNYTLRFYPTKDGEVFIRNKKSTYYLTYWIDGREANFNVLNDILKCSEFMARFHLASRGIENSQNIKIQTNYGKLGKNFQKKLNDIERIRKMLDTKYERTAFDLLYLKKTAEYISEAERVINRISDLNLKEYFQAMEKEKYICHDSFYYQNILIDKDYELYLIDFESCIFDIPVYDLGKFIRRILTRKKIAWDFDICRKLIDSYEKYRELSTEELCLLYLIIIFPYKFWKLGKKKFLKTKNWREERYLKKLEKLIELNKYKNEFSDCYLGFYGIRSYVEV